jgi:NAD(P)-dependent dehydrogenase (short-subunit alcohol dehydrogenase family)
MACPETKTVDGFERQFAVNHLAHFTLILKLLPTLLASSSPDSVSRLIQVSSSSHRYSTVHWDNISLAGEYDPFISYGQSKTAMIWTTNYIDRVYGPHGLRATSVHPGGIFTNLQCYAGDEQLAEWKRSEELLPYMQTPAQGAATTVWAATIKEVEQIGGKYLADCTIAPPTTNYTAALDAGYRSYAYDENEEERMWKHSLEWTHSVAPDPTK